MTQQEQLLEELLKLLILQPKLEEGSNPLVGRIRSGWLSHVKNIYPQLTLKLGKKADLYLIEYLRGSPPRSWNLQSFGSDLPLWLKDQVPIKKLERYLPELADFEWSQHWVQHAPSEVGPTKTFLLNPFVRYLKLKYGIFEWWKTKEDSPKLGTELVVISKDLQDVVLIFEPSITEAAIIDNLTEMSLSQDQLTSSVMTTLPGSQEIQIEVALNSLLEKGVLRGPTT